MSTCTNHARIEELQRFLAAMDQTLTAPERLNGLISAGFDQLPMPGSGHTSLRWQALAAVSEVDLSLGKLYEGHTDALAILTELGSAPGNPQGCASWGVWAAEAATGRVTIEHDPTDGTVRLSGTKYWCSGAAGAGNALVTAWFADGRGPQLVRISLAQSGVRARDDHWHAVGMAASASLTVAFDRARARLVGEPGDYLNRPGFWQGGAGIAACWYGGTLAIAHALRRALTHCASPTPNPFRLAALGRVDVLLQSTAALLRQGAAWIDSHPSSDASAMALQLRLCTETTATQVLNEVGRALGATPFCGDAKFARAAADLPVFIRQSHAERDLAALGERLLQPGGVPWRL